LLALVTVRVARTRPAGRHVLPRPRWTYGKAGSRRPTRSRYRIGPRQHTKGAVENANGRLRRDLPRDLDLDALSDAGLQEIVLTHDLTPRKCLGFLTPLQALLEELGKDVQIRFA
jgi:IS30 family transposase